MGGCGGGGRRINIKPNVVALCVVSFVCLFGHFVSYIHACTCCAFLSVYPRLTGIKPVFGKLPHTTGKYQHSFTVVLSLLGISLIAVALTFVIVQKLGKRPKESEFSFTCVGVCVPVFPMLFQSSPTILKTHSCT